MKLLDALVDATKDARPIASRDGAKATCVYFVFTEDNNSAFLSELDLEELVPLLEEWCRQRRIEMGPAH